MTNQNATVFEVAREAGVSQITVSRAFSGKAPVAEKTGTRIMAAARRLGYQPNRLAAGLRGGRTRSIGMIWSFVDPWAGDSIIALDVLQRQQQHGYATYQSQYSEEDGVLAIQLDDLLGRRVDALIVWALPRQLRDPDIVRRLQAVPTIAVCREDVPEFPGDLIVHNRDSAIVQVVDHFVATGRRRPTLMLVMQHESNPPKLDAFLGRCRHHGLMHDRMSIDLDVEHRVDSHGERHATALTRAMSDGLDVDAIFCVNDIGALFVIRELASRGVSVPDDVAVVGFNNTEAGRAWMPALATADRKPFEMAQAIDHMLLKRLEHADLPVQRQTIDMQFIRRESAG